MLKQTIRSMSFKGLSAFPILMIQLKRGGFAHRQIAAHVQKDGSAGPIVTEAQVRNLRQETGIQPSVKQIETLAAEFPAETNYLYLTYSGSENDVELASKKRETSLKATVAQEMDVPGLPYPTTVAEEGDSRSGSNIPSNAVHEPVSGAAGSRIIVLGFGCYRIGSSVESDWSSVSCIKTLRALGHSAAIINCNPETVSTDFDESGRLYFEELSHETVMDTAELEVPQGVIVSVGGQTPNNLAMKLHQQGVKILATSVEAIDASRVRTASSSASCATLCVSASRSGRNSRRFEKPPSFARMLASLCLCGPRMCSAAPRCALYLQRLIWSASFAQLRS